MTYRPALPPGATSLSPSRMPLLIAVTCLLVLELLPSLTATTALAAGLWCTLGILIARRWLNARPGSLALSVGVLFVVQMLVNTGMSFSAGHFAAQGWNLESFLWNAVGGLLVAVLLAGGEAALRHVVRRALTPLSLVSPAPALSPEGRSFNLHIAPAELSGAVIRGAHALRAPPVVLI